MKPKIVVVDDDQELLDELELILDEEGYQVSALDATVFTKVIEDISPDVLLVDVWFGDFKGGITLAKAVKNSEHLKETPLVLMSSDPRIEEYAAEANADTYITKPINVDELLTSIERVLH